NRNVGHVHGLIDIGNILRRCKNTVAQDGLTDKTRIDKIVIGRTDIELDVNTSINGLSLIRNYQPARRQRRPADIVAAGSPGNPSRPPIQIAAGEPKPAIVSQVSPAP